MVCKREQLFLRTHAYIHDVYSYYIYISMYGVCVVGNIKIHGKRTEMNIYWSFHFINWICMVFITM